MRTRRLAGCAIVFLTLATGCDKLRSRGGSTLTADQRDSVLARSTVIPGASAVDRAFKAREVASRPAPAVPADGD